MKRFFLVMVAFVFVLSACDSMMEKMLKNNIAEMREYILVGSGQGVSVSLMCGVREKDYVINGYASDAIEFGVLTFELDDIDDFDVSQSKYVLFVGSVRYDGVLVQNPFDQTLVVDIGKKVDRRESIVARIAIGDFVQELALTLLNKDWKVDADKAIKIVAKNYKDELKGWISNNKFGGEIYVKILDDADIYKGDYYWYVNVVSRKGDSISLIISPYTAEILASNVRVGQVS